MASYSEPHIRLDDRGRPYHRFGMGTSPLAERAPYHFARPDLFSRKSTTCRCSD